MAYIAYRYGVRVLREHNEPPELADELVRRTRYWNNLVEADKAFRERVDEIVAPYITGDTEDEQRASRKAALKLPEVKAAIAMHDSALRERVRKLRGESGLQTANYRNIERSWDTARARAPRNLRFHRANPREGTLIHDWTTGGFPVQSFLGNTLTRCSIEPLPPETFAITPVNARLRASWTPFRFRVAGTRTNPIYLTGLVCLHRPLPEDGLVRQAILRVSDDRGRRRVTYELTLLIEVPDAEPAARRETWALNMGWRQIEGGLRVATAVSDSGEQASLVLPQKLVDLFRRQRGLESTIDTLRDEIKAQLLAARAELATQPEWFAEATATMAQWRSVGRFHSLWRRWERFDGDEAMYSALTAWRHRARHLEQYLAGVQHGAARARKYLYGQWVNDLVSRAGAIVLENTNWAQLAQADDQYAGWQRGLASPGMVAERIRNTATREGVAVIKADAAHATVDCSWCSHRNDYDAVRSVVVRCARCFREYDQDINAARNLLARATGDSSEQVGSAPRESRWARTKRLKAEAAEKVAEEGKSA